jgi:branched-chain amino acid transport system substrate-binding protein
MALLTAACASRITNSAQTTTGSSGATGTSNASGSQSSQGVTSDTITVGVDAPLSGVAGFLGQEFVGPIQAYFDMVNANGGVNGRKLKLDVLDDGFNETQASANVRRLVSQDNVFAVYGSFSDPYNDYVVHEGIPTYVFGVTIQPFETKYPNVYPLVGNALAWTLDEIGAYQQLHMLKKGMRVAILYDSQVVNVSAYVPEFVKAWQSAGADVVSTDSYTLTSGDCTSLVLKMRSLNIAFWDFDTLGWPLCVSAAQRLNYHPTVGWGSWATSVSGLAGLAGPAVTGVWGGSEANQPSGKPGGNGTTAAAEAEYVNAIKTYAPSLDNEGSLESPATTGYWAGAAMLVAAIRAQGKTVTWSGVNNWMQRLNNFPTGIMPPIRSMGANCKQGQPAVWVGQWNWDAQTKTPVRTPTTGWVYPVNTDVFGTGSCWLTQTSNRLG